MVGPRHGPRQSATPFERLSGCATFLRQGPLTRLRDHKSNRQSSFFAMSDVGWGLEKCKANAIEYIDVDCDDLAKTLDRIARLKLNQNLSAIRVLLPDSYRRFGHHHKKAIDSIAGLLKANTNIKNLRVDNLKSYAAHVRAKRYLLETLANGKAGDNLVYLWDDFRGGSTDEVDALQKYMEMSHNLRRLRIHREEGPASLQLVSGLSRTNITDLCIEVWPYRGMGEVGAAIGQCSSILSLKVIFRFENGDEHLTDMESFLRRADKLRCLSRLEIDLQGYEISEEMIAAIGALVVRQGALTHFGLITCGGCRKSWQGLGLALRSVKSISLCLRSPEALLSVLPKLQACESLKLSGAYDAVSLQPIGEVTSHLPNLTDVAFGYIRGDSMNVREYLLAMIKKSTSIATVHVNGASASLQGSIDSFCILNRVFGTNLIGFGPSEVWTRILSKVSNGSAKVAFLYRLLREKPELIVGSMHAVREEGSRVDIKRRVIQWDPSRTYH